MSIRSFSKKKSISKFLIINFCRISMLTALFYESNWYEQRISEFLQILNRDTRTI